MVNVLIVPFQKKRPNSVKGFAHWYENIEKLHLILQSILYLKMVNMDAEYSPSTFATFSNQILVLSFYNAWLKTRMTECLTAKMQNFSSTCKKMFMITFRK